MRICLVTHGFPPVERTGVENYTEALASALGRAGHRIEVFVPRRDPVLANFSVRREQRRHYAVNWVTSNEAPRGPRDHLILPGMQAAFADFLDRERPEVVHFQHLIKLGIDLVDEARRRGIPSVYTAHDYYPICHRYTLLRPDLERCDVRADARACSHCDLALGFLNGLGRLGDYQMGALPAQLDIDERQTLAGILAGRVPAGREEEFEHAHSQRRDLDQQRAAAFEALGRILAPSRFLADELARGGIPRDRIEVLPYGFQNEDLEAVARSAPVRPAPGARLRFGFLGGLGKHKGVHVLLDAFEKVSDRCELSVWGDSSDGAYVELLRRRAGEVGALWRGPYERPDLPVALAEVDVVVVPSIWVENQPLVIHEAFSAGRPVLASRVGALPESVHHEIDGLLFEVGDAEDLADAMTRCIEEEGLVARLVGGIRPVKTIAENARELVRVYEDRIAGVRRGDEGTLPLPGSVLQAMDRHRELSSLPARELFMRVLSGLDDLREAWSDELGPVDVVELLALGLGGGSEAQDQLRESKAEIAWLRTKKSELDRGREELIALFEEAERGSSARREQERALAEAQERVRRGEEEVTAARTRLHELEELLQATEGRAREAETQLDEAGRYIRGKEDHTRTVESELGEAERYIRRKEDEVRDISGALGKAGAYIQRKESELTDLKGRLDEATRRTRERERELDTARVELVRLEEDAQRSVADMQRTAEVGFQAVQAIERLFGRALWPAIERMRSMLGRPADEDGRHTLHGILQSLRELGGGLATLESELEWRRNEMQRLERKLAGGLPRVVFGRTGVGRQVDRWRAHESEIEQEDRG